MKPQLDILDIILAAAFAADERRHLSRRHVIRHARLWLGVQRRRWLIERRVRAYARERGEDPGLYLRGAP